MMETRGGGRGRGRDIIGTGRCLYLLLLVLLIVLGCGFISPGEGDIAADGRALLGFLNGLVDFPNSMNWSNYSNPCTWQGVGCSTSQDSVETLQLPGSGLYGNIKPGTLGALSTLRILSLRSNHLTGAIPADLANCTHLRKLFLQNNQLSGHIPSFNSTYTPGLSVIDLSANLLTGAIPESLATLSLRILFLQNNSLSGSILQDLPNLQDLDLSNNNLSGSIPPALVRFKNTSFIGNPGLCGPPLTVECAGTATSSPAAAPTTTTPNAAPPASKSGLSKLDIVLIVVADVVFLLLMVVCLMLWRLWRHVKEVESGDVKKKKETETGNAIMIKDDDEWKDGKGAAEQNKLVFFKQAGNRASEQGFDLEDLLRASAEVLGKGSFGTAYKAVLEDGPTVVVKRLKEVAVGRKDFESHMDAVGRLRHSALLPLLAYYYSKEEKLLVHDYVPLGSLASALHGPNKEPLEWERRLKVALEAARGLEAVHTTSSKAVHGDIKSSNILLTEEGRGCMISDYGMAALFSPNAVIARMVGYRAPEVAETRRVTQKSDVYSFGVVLLELLTGKAPSRTTAEEGMELPRWVQSVVREEWTAEVFDKNLASNGGVEEEMVHLLQIALNCVCTAPDRRLSMAQVSDMLAGIRPSIDHKHKNKKLDDQGSATPPPPCSTTPSSDFSSPQDPSPPPPPQQQQQASSSTLQVPTTP